MTDAPTWTIMVPTLGERRPLFQRLMDVLLPQLDVYEGRVQVLAWFNNGNPRLTTIRQRMVTSTATEYVSCVDDDDLVPSYFVAEVVSALASRPDYVGWKVQCYSDEVPTAISHHSLKYGGWWSNGGIHYRDLSHLNPIRTELARLADFRLARRGQPEDRAWVAQLRETGKVRTEVFINRVMYHYLFSTSRTAGIGSRWSAGPRSTAITRIPIEHPYFSYMEVPRAS